MYNEQDKEIFPFASRLKEEGRGIPFILLIHYSKAVRQRVLESPHPGVDFVFSWHGNADLILAIVKLLEDAANAENDVFEVGVKASFWSRTRSVTIRTIFLSYTRLCSRKVGSF